MADVLLHTLPPVALAVAGAVVGAAAAGLPTHEAAAAVAAAARGGVQAALSGSAQEVDGIVVSFEDVLLTLSSMRGAGLMQVDAAKAWLRSLPGGDHAASVLGKLSSCRNVDAHAMA